MNIGIVIVLRDNLDLVGHEVRRVESHTELSNHGNVRAGRQCLHEGLGSGFGNGAQIVDQIGLGHANARVFNGQSVIGLVGNELDLQFRLRIEHGRVGQALVTNLVEGIGRVRDEFAKENLLVGVEGVDDQREELVDVCREGVAFRISGGGGAHGDWWFVDGKVRVCG